MPTSANEPRPVDPPVGSTAAASAEPAPPPARGSTGAEPVAASTHPRSESQREHSREHFWNWPNTITVLRISVVPLFLLLPLPLLQTKAGSALVAWLFIVAAASDLLDGWLARRGQQVTKIGVLLDPLADKLLVSTALIMLLAIGRLDWWGAWMVVVIVGRELAVTGLRGIASSDGRIMAASAAGKLKAVFQNIAIGALLFHYPTLGLPAHDIGLLFLSLAAVLTLWSGYLYFAEYFGGSGRPPVPAAPAAEPPDTETR
jgi:CDP-diacylglycerol--glycerol-3-phosphate 3-phosphatidyltransferase